MTSFLSVPLSLYLSISLLSSLSLPRTSSTAVTEPSLHAHPPMGFEMALPPKKKPKLAPVPSDGASPAADLHSDYRISWLLASHEALVELKVKDETFRVHKSILTRHSDYFNTCLTKPFKESADGRVSFDDIEPRYMAYYLGLAYSYSSIVPHALPLSDLSPGPGTLATTLRDYIEVYRLCDRFLSEPMRRYMLQCINATIGDRHRALYRSSADADTAQQRALMRDFADGYEALETAHDEQRCVAASIIEYFCEGVDYDLWDTGMDDVMDRPRFVAMVSKGFARKLAQATAQRTKLKRKQLSGPY